MSIACNYSEASEAKAEAWVKTYCEETHPELSYVSKSTIQGEFDNLTQMTMVVIDRHLEFHQYHDHLNPGAQE